MLVFVLKNTVGATVDIEKPQSFDLLMGAGGVSRDEQINLKTIGTFGILQEPEDITKLFEYVKVEPVETEYTFPLEPMLILVTNALFTIMGEVVDHKENIGGLMTISEGIERFAENKAIVIAAFKDVKEFSKMAEKGDFSSRLATAPQLTQ